MRRRTEANHERPAQEERRLCRTALQSEERPMTGTLPQWCADIISGPPRSGEGFHNWLFRAARGLWKCGRHGNDIRELLQNAAASCGRHVSEREILDAVRHSQTSAFQLTRARHQPWPAVSQEQREAVIATGLGLVDLWEISPVRSVKLAVRFDP